MENTYDKALNCKFHGKIEKIKTDLGPQNCEISYVITVKDDNELYLLQGIGKNTTNPDTSCTYERMYYAFSGTYPKVGDDLYVVAEGLSNDIKETGKSVYDANQDLNLCIQYPYSFMGGYIQERYEIMNICKVSGKIETITKTPGWENCYYDLKLKINHNNQVSYSYNTTEQLIDKDGMGCLGGNYMYNGGPKYSPKVGDDFYGIVKTETNELLKTGINNYNQYINILDCTGSIITSQTGELLSDSGIVINKNLNEIQTGKIVENNISIINKKEINIPKKIIYSNNNKNTDSNIKKIDENIISSRGNLDKESVTDSGITNLTGVSNKPYKTETGIAVKKETTTTELVSNSTNGFYIFIIAIIISRIFIFKIKRK